MYDKCLAASLYICRQYARGTFNKHTLINLVQKLDLNLVSGFLLQCVCHTRSIIRYAALARIQLVFVEILIPNLLLKSASVGAK